MSRRVIYGLILITLLGFFGGALFHALFGFLGSLFFTIFVTGLGFYAGRQMAHAERRRELH